MRDDIFVTVLRARANKMRQLQLIAFERHRARASLLDRMAANRDASRCCRRRRHGLLRRQAHKECRPVLSHHQDAEV